VLQKCNNTAINVYIKKQMKGQTAMYTVDETGVMNNYAVEPQLSFAEYPSPEQQRRYMFQGVVAVLLVAGTIFTALAVS
jgi:hypothetical protein